MKDVLEQTADVYLDFAFLRELDSSLMPLSGSSWIHTFSQFSPLVRS